MDNKIQFEELNENLKKLNQEILFLKEKVHNLKSSASAIFTRATILSKNYPNDLHIIKIISISHGINDSINKLLDSNKDETFEEISLYELVKFEIESFRNDIKHQNILFESLLSEVPLIYGNKEDLIQVTQNLLSNAVYAVKDSKNKIITIELKADETEIMLIVTDTGCGIPEVSLNQIFDPYYSTKRDKVKDQSCGFGLGLSFVKSTVERHYGRIAVQSELNSFTSFKINFLLTKN